MVMYHMFASGVELGSNTLRICSANGPTVCAGCAKDDSIEIIKRSDYGVLKMVENNSFLRAQCEILSTITHLKLFHRWNTLHVCDSRPIYTVPIFPICPTKPFVCVEDFCSTDQFHDR